MKKIRKALWFKCIAIVLALIMFEPSTQAVVSGVPPRDGPSVILEICVILIVGIFVAGGSCAAKKLIDKIPPSDPPPPPPPRPGETNTPPKKIIHHVPRGYSLTSTVTGGTLELSFEDPPTRTNQIALRLPQVEVGPNNEGMTAWFISSNPHLATNLSLYSDPEGNAYTHIYVASVQTRTNSESAWTMIGSRVLWVNTNATPFAPSTATIGYYDRYGNQVAVDYVSSTQYKNPNTPPDTVSSVRIMDWEIIPGAVQQQFRLVGCTNEIGILTEP